VTRSYRELYRNRQDKLHLDNIASHQERARLRQDEAPQYRPKTNHTTARLADKKRQTESIQGGYVPQRIEERLVVANNALESKRAD
jgi:hypothetical protein